MGARVDAQSVHFGVLGNGSDSKMHMVRAHSAGHNPMKIGRLPASLPSLIHLAAQVRADKRGNDSRRDVRRSTDPFIPPADERSQLGAGQASLARIELSEGDREPVIDPSDHAIRARVFSRLSGWLQSGANPLAAASTQLVLLLVQTVTTAVRRAWRCPVNRRQTPLLGCGSQRPTNRKVGPGPIERSFRQNRPPSQRDV